MMGAAGVNQQSLFRAWLDDEAGATSIDSEISSTLAE